MSNATDSERYAVVITLRTGVQIEFECSNFETRVNGLKETVGAVWSNAVPRVPFLRWEQVDAVTCRPLPA